MEHARKMVVVPQELIERMQETSGGGCSNNPSKPSSLDAELHCILNDKQLDDMEKWKQYQQVLQRFLHFSAVKRKPISLSIIEEGGRDHVAHRASVALVDELVETLPKIYKTNARNLLHVMSRQGSSITWDAQGTVYVNSEKVENSNIVDIMHNIVRVRKIDRLPNGWQEVMQALKDMNVPKEYVGNPTARRFLGVGLDKASSPWENTTVPMTTSTPMSSRMTPIQQRLRPRQHSPRPPVRRQLIIDKPLVEDENDSGEWLDKWEPLPI